MDTDLGLTAVRRHVLTEDDGWRGRHPDGEVSQDRSQDGSPLLMPPDTEQRTQHELRKGTVILQKCTHNQKLFALTLEKYIM